MDLRFADDVRTIVEEGSISDAAKRLNISQPALSARVRKLEELYGIQVFKRNRRPMTLTDEGRMYLEYAAKAQNLDKEFRKSVEQTDQLLTGELIIGGTHLYTCQFLPPAVCEFSRRYPGVDVRVINEKAPVLTSMAAKGKIDLFITNAEKKASGISYEPLFPVSMYFCVPRSYPVNREFQESGFDLAKLEDCPFILLDKSQYMGATLRKLFRRYGIDPVKRIYTDQAITALALAEAGVGVALMYGSPTKPNPELDDSTTYRYTTDDEEMRVQISVAYAENASLSPAARVFIDTLKESSNGL